MLKYFILPKLFKNNNEILDEIRKIKQNMFNPSGSQPFWSSGTEFRNTALTNQQNPNISDIIILREADMITIIIYKIHQCITSRIFSQDVYVSS